MENEAPDRRKQHYSLRRSIQDYGFGVFFLFFGVFLAVSQKLGYVFAIDDFFRYMFSGILLLYGGWRIYRGYKKNYYN